MANISGLTQVTTAATTLSNLILVSPQKTIGYQPVNPPVQNGAPVQQPPALLFHYEGEQTVLSTCDITDHFIENNSAIQDMIAIKPNRITTHGFIGELNDVAPPALALAQTIANKLVTIGGYTPVLSATALIAYNTAFAAYQLGASAVTSAVSAWSSLTGNGGESVINGNTGTIGTNGSVSGAITSFPNQTKQQIMYQQFYGYQQARVLFTVQTPWAVFTNMAIESLRAIQDATTQSITDFELTFKQLRFANTQALGPVNPANAQGQLATQSAPLTDNGTYVPNPTSLTQPDFLSQFSSLGVAS